MSTQFTFDREDYFTYEELKLLSNSDIPLIHFEIAPPQNYEEAKIALLSKELLSGSLELTESGIKIAHQLKEYCKHPYNIRFGDIHFSPSISIENRYFLLSRFDENKFQIRIVDRAAVWSSILDQYPFLMREESSNDFIFRTIDDEALAIIDNAGVNTITNAMELEIISVDAKQQHSIYQIYEQYGLLFMYYPDKKQTYNIHSSLIISMLFESLGFNKEVGVANG
ncbi:DUF5081 family protein [Macrococcus capreoli]|uniref:DUF5081 family protein n=1 Tax=Macrococcus capreoli TaxID=2982690 RepID=UPI0021D5C2B5|nr:DUF5081 family protein [Macrococcus sp. TMW 2.2395]MCU7557219.1 DUF5081 family protein [Macrococcus sp. TMW 2.2395]